MLRLVKLYASGITTADAVITYTVPWRANLVGMQIMAQIQVSAAAAESLQWEFSLQSTSQFTTNEAQNVICNIGANSIVAAAHFARSYLNLAPNLSFESGGKIYVHRLQNSAPAAGIIQACLYFK